MLDDELAQQVIRKTIEDVFNLIWYNLEIYLELISNRYPFENAFVTEQLGEFGQSVNALADSRAHHQVELLRASTDSRYLRSCAGSQLPQTQIRPMDASFSFPSQPLTTNQFADLRNSGSDLQASNRLRTPPPISARCLPTPGLHNLILDDFGREILTGFSWTMNEDPAEDQNVDTSTAYQIPHQANTSLSAIALGEQLMPASTVSRSSSTDIASVRHRENGSAKLQRLTFSIMNRDYLMRLKANILALRNCESLKFSGGLEDVARIFEQLEETEATHALRHRLLRFRLVRIRDKIARDIKLKRTSGIRPEHGARRVEDQVLDILVERIYQYAKRADRTISIRAWRQKFKAERTSIKNRLCTSRIWRILNEEFGPGILILVPWSGQTGSLNHSYQSTKGVDQKRLCCLLRQQDNGLIQEIASALTPFVDSILNGRQPPQLQIESDDPIPFNIDRSIVISMLKESSDA